MPNKRKPRDGSLMHVPKKRAKKETPRIRSWAPVSDVKLLGFPGYKVGMTHVMFNDNRKNSMTKGDEIAMPVTVIECPPIKIASVVFYKNSPYGTKTVSSILSKKINKELQKKIPLPKEVKKNIDDIKEFDDLKVLVYTQPKLTTIGKKKPALLELAIGGKKEDKLAWVKENLEKDILVQDIIKAGQLVDIHAVTKGHGLQGPVRRDGIGLKNHKSQKSRRKAVLGAEGDAKVSFRAHQSGQHGYHRRMEHNKWIVSIGDKPEEVNNKGGYNQYGVVKNSYILIKGGVAGARKRLVLMTTPIRENKKLAVDAPTIQQIII